MFLLLYWTMIYIYMDESGDLNINNIYWSNFFVITFLITSDEKDMKIVMKNLHSWMKWKWIKMKWTFFHSTKEEINSVKRLLDLVSRRNIKIASHIIDKSKIPYKLLLDKHNFYNEIVKILLWQCEIRWFFSNNTNVHFIASRRETNKILNQKFVKTVNEWHSNLINIDIFIKSPKEESWLEIVDALSRAMYKKYEENNFELYSIIKNHIVLEKLYDR